MGKLVSGALKTSVSTEMYFILCEDRNNILFWQIMADTLLLLHFLIRVQLKEKRHKNQLIQVTELPPQINPSLILTTAPHCKAQTLQSKPLLYYISVPTVFTRVHSLWNPVTDL